MSYLEGHRQRLRDRLKSSGLEAFEDHEVLELILTYAIPRRDVKPIAHELLRRFGTLANVLDASPEELGQVEGVGDTAAVLLHLVPRLTRRYLANRWGSRPLLDSVERISRFAVDTLATECNEVFLLIGLTHQHQLIQAIRVTEGTLTSAPVYPRLVIEAALRMNAARVVLAHNHPGGRAEPSEEDVQITRRLEPLLAAIGAPVMDHVIVAGPLSFSFVREGLHNAP